MPHTDEEFAEMERALRGALACIERHKAFDARMEKRLANIEKRTADIANLLDAMGETAAADKIREATVRPQWAAVDWQGRAGHSPAQRTKAVHAALYKST